MKLEEALKESEERYRTLFEQAPIGLYVFDRELRLTACNDTFAQMMQAKAADLVGLDLTKLRDPRPVPAMRDALEGKVSTWEGFYLSTVSGVSVHLHARFAPLRDSEGSVAYGLGFIEDVSERKAMEAQLRRADRMAAVGTLAAGVAHEINNPLAYLKANLDVAASRTIPDLLKRTLRLEDGDPAVREKRLSGDLEQLLAMIQLAREGAERVRTIVADLRTFSRGDDEVKALVDVRRILDACINVGRREIEQRGEIVREYEEVPLVPANEARLGQVFLNLLLNAAQALPEGEPHAHRIHVSVRDVDNHVRVSITDDGIGMDDATMQRIFDPFFTTKPNGLGLGLWICQGIVAAMGGQIVVKSQAGKGATFTVVLPH